MVARVQRSVLLQALHTAITERERVEGAQGYTAPSAGLQSMIDLKKALLDGTSLVEVLGGCN